MADADRAMLAEVLNQAADRATAEIRGQEGELPGWFKAQGRTVQAPDRAAFRAAFRAACVPLHNGGVGWTRQQYDRLQTP